MNKLFPNATPYEIINYTDIPYTSFQLIKDLEIEKNKIDFFSLIYLLIFALCIFVSFFGV